MFDELWQFPNCLGAMDGKHVAIAAPRSADSLYYNYKKFNSIVLLAIVDAKYWFSLIDIGCNGRVSDGGVFQQCKISSALRENWLQVPQEKVLKNSNISLPHVVVADDAFRLQSYSMKPYKDYKNETHKNVFNYRLSRARRVVENAFGILSNLF
ncbi:uncharacterized protein LOC124719871 [Schistocerca piceifrons]|uniref:uncharacterized protein LOC124719871 n=1 Tax=Schistocerca piceifrons TaxID=274613 RepID=UPI001F5F10E1|nr:uncharacterized protein LOC124719871 [Schistocerca piceifrons]